MAAIYLLLLLRGTFEDPAIPRSLGLLVFALLHGGSASVSVPPVPALLGIGGSAELGLPVTSFALLPFILLLVSSRYIAIRARSDAAFALATIISYAILVGLLAALGGGSIGTDDAAIELGAGPLSASANAFLLAGVATALGVSAAHGPLLPARVRQVVRGALAAVVVSGGLALLLAVAVALIQGVGEPAPPAPPQEAESGSFRDALSLLGSLMALAPSALGTLWLLAHGVPIGVQDPSTLASLPLVGPALADTPLRISLLGTWPYGFGWRPLLLAPLVSLVAGGTLAARGASHADRWRQGALVAVPYTLVTPLVAMLARVTADLTLAGASLSVSLGASLPWLLCVLLAAALLGALGGYVSPFGGDAPAAYPRRAFLATTAACAAVLLLSLPSLFGSRAGEELLGSAIPGEDPPEKTPALQTEPPAQGDVAPPEAPDSVPPPIPPG